MQFEKIRTIDKSKIIIGGLIGLGLVSTLIYLPSKAKYRTTESFNIVNGTINYKVPDFNIVAMYSSEDGSNYTELTGRMPSSGYAINESKSYCNLNGSKDTNTILKTIDGNHVISNLIKGNKCYLYFDKKTVITIPDIIATLNAKPTTLDFSKIAIANEGVYTISDLMYGGTSYYYRGAVTNNYVMFANYCWRIVRINGDESIRMIYDGTSCHANGTSTVESIAVTSQAYKLSYNKSEYVGYTYTSGSQRTLAGTASNLKTQTETWFNANITGANAEKVADGKFCNDRNTASGYTWSTIPSSTFYYAAYGRLVDAKTPTLACDTGDVYTLKVGAITADEASFAGGVYKTANNKYYLYNGQYYWTMSPYRWNYLDSSSRYAVVFAVYSGGSLNAYNVDVTNPGVRPVINLRADTIFSSGDGTIDTPYTVQ